MSTVRDSQTADDLLMMPDGENYELVNGRLEERNMSQESSWVSGEIYGQMRDAIRNTTAGWAFPEGTSYQCFQHLTDDPERTRRPDASFIRKERLPGGPLRKGHCRVPPDLVAEVVSPGDEAYDVNEKVEDWLAAGVLQVWVVMPPARTVTIHRPDGRERILHEDDELTAEGLIPGFRCRVGDLFPQLSAPE